MAYVQFRAAAVRDYGLPQACPCCGNDDDGELVLGSDQEGVSNSWKYGCCLISLFFGPIGWIAALLNLFRKSPSLPFPIPTCRLCREASEALRRRCAVIVVSSILLVISRISIESHLVGEFVMVFGYLMGFLGLVEFLALKGQFSVRVKKSNSEAALVKVPYEDYPALYQRHLDNAVLYGSSEKLGAREE